MGILSGKLRKLIYYENQTKISEYAYYCRQNTNPIFSNELSLRLEKERVNGCKKDFKSNVVCQASCTNSGVMNVSLLF